MFFIFFTKNKITHSDNIFDQKDETLKWYTFIFLNKTDKNRLF